ncbi:hypothetical protein GY03_14090 [Proteus vulgaris]|nr:hypothetical protein [Proteus vulgaris]MCT6518403.1 hypothetical protein [Proteus vulgaris]
MKVDLINIAIALRRFFQIASAVISTEALAAVKNNEVIIEE